ncbi:hypothetical protein B0A48_17273 [Cryoendolithus antarcticus]|uniref:Uncharacterized protein n=1 Tax=Cryoendolithus antarcticus TaxID=1507870 RepID=A0A1V8SC32_9PEZI|nr:hypothetical protein B0A48_17273 [Cryoendolithus antarcticus]
MKIIFTSIALLCAYAHAAPLSIPKHNEIKYGKPKALEERQLIESVVGLGLGAAAITTAGLTVGLLDKRDTPAPISTLDEIKAGKPKDLEERQLIESVVGLGVGGAIITAAGLTVGLLDKKDVVEAERQVSSGVSRRDLAKSAPIITISNTEPNSTNITLIRYADMSYGHMRPATGEAQAQCRLASIFHKGKCDRLYPIGQPGWLELDRNHNVASQSGLPVASRCWTQVYKGQKRFCESSSDALYGGKTRNVTSIPHDSVNVPSTSGVKKTGNEGKALQARAKPPKDAWQQLGCVMVWPFLGASCKKEKVLGEPIDGPKPYAVDAKGRLVEDSHRPAYGTCYAQRREGYHHYCADPIKHSSSVGSQSGGAVTGGVITLTGDLKHGSAPSIQTGGSPSANGTYFATSTPGGPGLRSDRPVIMKDGELFTTGNATVVPGRKVWIEPTR